MRRIWVVVICVLITACSRTSERGLPGDLKVVHDGCARAEPMVEKKAVDLAVKYFRSEVGVSVKDIESGYVSLCEETLVIPISARTDQVPTRSIWFVEMSASSYQPIQLMRPM